MELANVTIQTNKANRKKEAAALETPRSTGAKEQYCMSTQPGRPCCPPRKLSCQQGLCAILHQNCHMVG